MLCAFVVVSWEVLLGKLKDLRPKPQRREDSPRALSRRSSVSVRSSSLSLFFLRVGALSSLSSESPLSLRILPPVGAPLTAEIASKDGPVTLELLTKNETAARMQLTSLRHRSFDAAHCRLPISRPCRRI